MIHLREACPKNPYVSSPCAAQNGQPSELDKLVTIAKMAAAQLNAAETTVPNVTVKAESGTYASSGGAQRPGEAVATVPAHALNRAEMPLISAAVASPISVQDPAAVNVLQALVSQLQQKQIDETPATQQQVQQAQLQASPALQSLEQVSSHVQQPLKLAGAQASPTAAQVQPTQQQDILRQVSQLQYPLLQMAPVTQSNAAAPGAQAVLAPLGSVVNAAPLQLNPYSGHTLAAPFGSSMTLVQVSLTTISTCTLECVSYLNSSCSLG